MNFDKIRPILVLFNKESLSQATRFILVNTLSIRVNVDKKTELK